MYYASCIYQKTMHSVLRRGASCKQTNSQEYVVCHTPPPDEANHASNDLGKLSKETRCVCACYYVAWQRLW